ncbi:hypothetical protein [Streptosporangium sp. NPDC006007]|uniref:hypothetical protein n=1 Tax=Streptosporangium sp. NPDC006007 TaxID=3154575 RepID=UPI0033BF5F3F
MSTALGAAATGLFVAWAGDVKGVSASPVYLVAVTALLAVGLYGSASGIPAEAIRDVRRVVVAVTVGVLLKALLIAAVMLAFFPNPASLVLGVAVAQIDPLSVAAMLGHSQMTGRAKALLLAWASFDDPITALLTIYLSVFALRGMTADHAVVRLRPDLGPYLLNLGINILFVVAAWLLWRLLKALGLSRRTFGAVSVATLVLLVVFAVWQFLMLGVALVGLFYRPPLGRVLDRLINGAFYLAAFALGLLLVGEVRLVQGLTLGVAAFLSQVIVGGVLIAPRRMGVTDRVYLALGQQNGITAILLALSLQPVLPEAIPIVAPAILVINVLHIVSNAVWDRREEIPRWLRRRGSAEGTAFAKVARVTGVTHVTERASERLETALDRETSGSREW